MATEQNADMVTKAWTALVRGDADAALANMSDEISWVIPGHLAGVSGLKRGKDEVRKFISGIGQAFPGGLKSEIRKVHAVGDTVIVELTNRGTPHNGKPYENEYCFVYEIENGKIRRIRIRRYADRQGNPHELIVCYGAVRNNVLHSLTA